MKEIYPPSEDTYFFADFLRRYLKKNKIKSYLDMGCGNGFLMKTALDFLDKKDILGADINANAVNILKKKGFNCVKSDLFSNVTGKFDLITFNAPYLPEDLREPKESRLATTGGKRGDEIAVRFLEQAKKYLNKDGKIFLLISSLTPTDRIKNFNPVVVERKKIFLEELKILKINFIKTLK